jgi:hypothetical protein
MSRELRINYIYLDAVTFERFSLASDVVGWAYKSLVQQCLHAFLKAHRDYYVEAALTDANARGMASEDYYQTLRDGSEDDLARYLDGRPAFGATPLDDVPDIATGDENRRRYNIITLSNYNFVLLKVARIVDMGSMTQLVSRIVSQHFALYWDKNYRVQIDCDLDCKFR